MIGFIGSLLIGFALVLLIHEIIEKRWHAYICFLLLLFFNFFTFWKLYTMPISGTLEDVVGSFIGIAAGDQILSGITYFVFAVLYFSVYEYENFDQSVEYDTKPCPDCGKLLVTLKNRGIFCESCGALFYDDPQTIYKKCIECGSMAMTVSHIGLANCRECGHFTSNYLRDYHLRKTE